MIRFFIIASIVFISIGATAQNKLDLKDFDNAPQTILLTGFNDAYPIKLFGDYRLKGSILSGKDFLLTRFSAMGNNIERNGYSATGFMAVDGVGILSEVRYNTGINAKKKGFSVRNSLINRPQQGFMSGFNINSANFFTPIR